MLRSALLFALGAALISACVVDRERTTEGGQHPAGWLEKESPAFHGKYIAQHGTPALDDCQACHGLDYAGGPVGVTCNNAGCHEKGPESCGTCHGAAGSPRPMSGAHAKHAAYCEECHAVPVGVRSPGHFDGKVAILFSGVSRADNSIPEWSAEAQTCAGTYCHIDKTPEWMEVAEATPCDSCHGDPPASHARFSFVATKGSCGACHPAPPDQPLHINGSFERRPDVSCSACHGSGPLGAPAPALDGSADPSSPGVGAHKRHLDANLSDRIGRVVECSVCHAIPASVEAPGHLDESAPADVSLPDNGSFDAASLTCVAGCHWDRSPGPKWTDTSGAARACDACHGFPPDKTRKGTQHTLCAPELGACQACHTFDPSTHVDNHVDLKP